MFPELAERPMMSKPAKSSPASFSGQVDFEIRTSVSSASIGLPTTAELMVTSFPSRPRNLSCQASRRLCLRRRRRGSISLGRFHEPSHTSNATDDPQILSTVEIQNLTV